METLRGVFPAVPTEALLRVLEVCDQSVALASSWLLENDWQELLHSEAQDDDDDVVEVPPPATNATRTGRTASVATGAAGNTGIEADATSSSPAAAASPTRTMVVSTEVRVPEGNNPQPTDPRPFMARRSMGVLPFQQEEFDSEDEDEAAGNDEGDEDEDEEEDDMYYDSENEGSFGVGGAPRLTKKVKMARSDPKEGKVSAADEFWVAFDDQVMTKSLIELLNTTLSKLAHGKVVLLNRPAKEIDETEASAKLQTILYPSESASQDEAVGKRLQSSRGGDASSRGGITQSRFLNDGSPTSLRSAKETSQSSGSSATVISPKAVAGQKRKRKEETEDTPHRGFFAYFFPVRELDMVWRSVMHAHLFKCRFGETIEFHTASGGALSKQDFDDLMHIQLSAASSRAASLGFSPLSNLKCCLLLPCPANEEEMFRVGQNVHSVLKVQGSIYYKVNDPPQERSRVNPQNAHVELSGDKDKLTEERFRQFARYRVKIEVAADESPKPGKVGVDPFMSYQQPRKPSYSLEMLEADKWSVRLSR